MTPVVAASFLLAIFLVGCGADQRPAVAPEGVLQKPAEELFLAGRSAAARGDTVRAEQYLSAAIERGYDRGKALPVLLRVCLSSSRLRAALTHAEPYLRDHPEDDGLRYIVAIVNLGLGKTDEARLNLTELLRHDEKNADAHLVMGILESRSDATSARDHFQTYLELAPHGEHVGEARSRLAELALLGGRQHRFAKESHDTRPSEGAEGDGRDVGSSSPWIELRPPSDEAHDTSDGGPTP